MDLPEALAATIRAKLDGEALDGIPDWRTVAVVLDDDLTGAIACTKHEVVLADVKVTIDVTGERGCVECDIQECNDCSTYRQHLCQKHRDQVTA